MKFFKDDAKIFFVGIGGIGMSGLARLLHAKGFSISGTDAVASALTQELIADGIPVSIGHGDALPENLGLLVYSEAVPQENQDRVNARKTGVMEVNYFQALGEVSRAYRTVAISGSHGKTTTTAMLGLILINAGLDPTVLVGSKLKEFKQGNIHIGEGDTFVVEACEYRRNFLSLNPDLLAILNIEHDHVDYFKDVEDYNKAFQEFAEQSKEVIWPDDVSEYEGEIGVPGHHNKMNAGMAARLARRLGVSEGVISTSLAAFTGTWRRFEFKGEFNGAYIYDDYAHHPSEIQATLLAAREKHPESRIIAVFQPHQYSRAAHLQESFAVSFEEADLVIVPNIYEARDTEEDKRAVSAESFVDAIAEFHDDVRFGDGLQHTADLLVDELQSGDLVMIMGAGDVTNLSNLLI